VFLLEKTFFLRLKHIPMMIFFFKTFDFEEISIRNHGTMTVTNQDSIREFNGRSIYVHAGGRLSAVNLHVNVINVTVDALAVFEATLAGQNFELPGIV
jgi:hypothetical protein